MTTIQAVYENGVLRPVQPLDLPDGKQVQVVIYEMNPMPRLPPLPPLAPEVQAYRERLMAAKSLEEVFEIMNTAPPENMPDDYDLSRALNDNRRATGERLLFPELDEREGR